VATSSTVMMCGSLTSTGDLGPPWLGSQQEPALRQCSLLLVVDGSAMGLEALTPIQMLVVARPKLEMEELSLRHVLGIAPGFKARIGCLDHSGSDFTVGCYWQAFVHRLPYLPDQFIDASSERPGFPTQDQRLAAIDRILNGGVVVRDLSDDLAP